MVDFRENYIEFDVLQDKAVQYRLTYADNQSVYDHAPDYRTYFAEVQTVYDRPSRFRLGYIELQSIVAFTPSPWYDADTEGSDMSTEIFPELIGLKFDIKRRPMFSNKIQDHVSGKETRLAYWEEPKWEFDLSYDYVPNIPKSVGDTDLERILGFFLARKGNFQSFLYRFQDDYHVTNGYLGQGTGTNAEFTFARTIGPWSGPVDYVDFTSSPPEVYWDYVDQTYTIGSGPYTVNAPGYLSDPAVVVSGTTLTRITSGSPAANEYTLNETTGVFTFHSSRAGLTAHMSFRRTMQAIDYELTIPNQIVFTSAPPATVTVRSTFYYYFAVRFNEAVTEFNLFYDRLYELQELTLKSIIV